MIRANDNDTARRTVRPMWTSTSRTASVVLLAAGFGIAALSLAMTTSPIVRTEFVIAGIGLAELGGSVALLRRGLGANAVRGPGRPLAYGLAVGVALVYVAVTVAGDPYVRSHIRTLTIAKLAALPVALGAGSLEELIFRALLMDWLARRGLGPLVQVLISGLAFGMAHLYAFGGLGVAISAQVATTLLGFALAVVYLVAGRKLGPAIMGHSLVDLAIEPWLIAGFIASQ